MAISPDLIDEGVLSQARTLDAIEAVIGKPVTSINRAVTWHCLRLAGISERRDDVGHLFQNRSTRRRRPIHDR